MRPRPACAGGCNCKVSVTPPRKWPSAASCTAVGSGIGWTERSSRARAAESTSSSQRPVSPFSSMAASGMGVGGTESENTASMVGTGRTRLLGTVVATRTRTAGFAQPAGLSYVSGSTRSRALRQIGSRRSCSPRFNLVLSVPEDEQEHGGQGEQPLPSHAPRGGQVVDKPAERRQPQMTTRHGDAALPQAGWA